MPSPAQFPPAMHADSELVRTMNHAGSARLCTAVSRRGLHPVQKEAWRWGVAERVPKCVCMCMCVQTCVPSCVRVLRPPSCPLPVPSLSPPCPFLASSLPPAGPTESPNPGWRVVMLLTLVQAQTPFPPALLP